MIEYFIPLLMFNLKSDVLLISRACETGGLTSSPSRIMTSRHAKIEEHGTHVFEVRFLWYPAEYGIGLFGVFHRHAQWQVRS